MISVTAIRGMPGRAEPGTDLASFKLRAHCTCSRYAPNDHVIRRKIYDDAQPPLVRRGRVVCTDRTTAALDIKTFLVQNLLVLLERSNSLKRRTRT